MIGERKKVTAGHRPYVMDKVARPAEGQGYEFTLGFVVDEGEGDVGFREFVVTRAHLVSLRGELDALLSPERLHIGGERSLGFDLDFLLERIPRPGSFGTGGVGDLFARGRAPAPWPPGRDEARVTAEAGDITTRPEDEDTPGRRINRERTEAGVKRGHLAQALTELGHEAAERDVTGWECDAIPVPPGVEAVLGAAIERAKALGEEPADAKST